MGEGGKGGGGGGSDHDYRASDVNMLVQKDVEGVPNMGETQLRHTWDTHFSQGAVGRKGPPGRPVGNHLTEHHRGAGPRRGRGVWGRGTIRVNKGEQPLVVGRGEQEFGTSKGISGSTNWGKGFSISRGGWYAFGTNLSKGG